MSILCLRSWPEAMEHHIQLRGSGRNCTQTRIAYSLLKVRRKLSSSCPLHTHPLTIAADFYRYDLTAGCEIFLRKSTMREAFSRWRQSKRWSSRGHGRTPHGHGFQDQASIAAEQPVRAHLEARLGGATWTAAAAGMRAAATPGVPRGRQLPGRRLLFSLCFMLFFFPAAAAPADDPQV
jgi:hypothetical protein